MSSEELAEDITELLEGDDPLVDVAGRTVAVGASRLGVDHGHFTRIIPELDHWEAVASTDDGDGPVPVGLKVDLQTTFCRHAVREDETLAFHEDSSEDIAFDHADWTCYLTTPVEFRDELYGTLCFADRAPKAEPFDDADEAVVDCLAEVLETAIARDERELVLQNRNQLLRILGRVLRHNFRNDMTVVRGEVNRLLDRVDDPGIEEGALRSSIEDIITLVRKSRELREIAASEPELTEQCITEMLDRTIEGVEREYPDATFRLHAPAETRLVASPTVETALHELVENAAKHATPDPVCELTVAADADAVTVTVADDGNGLPEMERHVLQGERETPLSHGSGLGLWIVRWVASTHDGSVQVTTSDTGTTVTLTLPRPTENERLFEMSTV